MFFLLIYKRRIDLADWHTDWLTDLSKFLGTSRSGGDLKFVKHDIFFQNWPNCGKMKQDISETISQAFSELL